MRRVENGCTENSFVLFCSDENIFAINPDFVSGFRVSSRALFDSARPQVEPGTVPWALDLVVVENSFVEGSFLMSADISDSEVFSVDICYYYVLAVHGYLPHYTWRYLGR